MVVGKQGGECNVCGQQGASACSLQTDMVIFITLEDFFPHRVFCYKAVWVCVRVHECCMSPVIVFSPKKQYVCVG